ncbi:MULTISPECIES: GNAT family N-acetyltransferase [Brevibacterium]|uniref:N-acetyltransferase domain-containing protein n=1 Tax=Brevibacterium salitolerans TaxID=1403566 RepID=A0ABP5IJC9_9MICO|nr:GNAT family N-acetyltransferase [Brevibacterium sp.]
MTSTTPPASGASAPVPSGVRLRRWADGDDRALAQVLPDAGSPAQLAARALLRVPGDEPLTRTVVAEVNADGPGPSVVVGAAAVAESPAHPQRAWVHVEVAPEERGRGLGRALLEAVVAEAAGTALAGLGLRARVLAGEGVGEAFARAVGFTELFSTRIVRIDAGALGLAGADRIEDMQVIDTGSVALTRAFAQWYARTSAADPAAEMTLGQVNARFLSPAAGAHGAALWRPAGEDDPAREQDINRRAVTAFAVSFAREDAEAGDGGPGPGRNGAAGTAGSGAAPGTAAAEHAPFADLTPEEWASPALSAAGGEDATELTAGSVNGDPQDLRALLGRLSVEMPLVLEVTSEMETETAVVETLLDAGSAAVLAEYLTLVRDPQD